MLPKYLYLLHLYDGKKLSNATSLYFSTPPLTVVGRLNLTTEFDHSRSIHIAKSDKHCKADFFFLFNPWKAPC